VNNLLEALQRNLGNVLTPELVAGLLMASEEVKTPIDVESIPKTKHWGYALAVERLEDVVSEIHPIHVAHWEETEVHRHGVPLNIDYEYMINAERAGRFMLFTVRSPDGELVGNCMMYLTRSTHTKKLVAEEDTIFIRKDHRKGRLGIKLIRYVEDVLRAFGVTEIRVTVKTVNRVGDLLQGLGYRHTANQLVKVLGDSNDVQ
jgi:GNAT superfamily N-acetyltransferase